MIPLGTNSDNQDVYDIHNPEGDNSQNPTEEELRVNIRNFVEFFTDKEKLITTLENNFDETMDLATKKAIEMLNKLKNEIPNAFFPELGCSPHEPINQELANLKKKL